MPNLVYKLTKTKKLKASGFLDVDSMTIEVDGEEKKLSTLLREYDGCDIDFNISVKDEEDLDLPSEEDEEDSYDEE